MVWALHVSLSSQGPSGWMVNIIYRSFLHIWPVFPGWATRGCSDWFWPPSCWSVNCCLVSGVFTEEQGFCQAAVVAPNPFLIADSEKHQLCIMLPLPCFTIDVYQIQKTQTTLWASQVLLSGLFFFFFFTEVTARACPEQQERLQLQKWLYMPASVLLWRFTDSSLAGFSSWCHVKGLYAQAYATLTSVQYLQQPSLDSN